MEIKPPSPHPVDVPDAPSAPRVQPPPVGPSASFEAPDTTVAHSEAPKPPPDLKFLRQGFQAQADALKQQIAGLKWYQKLPGLGTKPDLVQQHALHTEAAQHVENLEQATLADALIKLPPKNRPQSIKQALDMTKAGDALLPQIMSGTLSPQQATKEKVAQIQWSLYNKAIQQLDAQAKAKGSPTREQLIGGMTVLDDGGKVAQFMQGLQRTGTGTGSYIRPSSHFTETRNEKAGKKSVGLGMDFTDPNTPLPAGKKTLLFGTKTDGDKTSSYLKGEYSGYDKTSDKLGHAFDFIKTNILGQRDVGRREKFIPKDIQAQYDKIGGPPLDPKQLKAGGISYMLASLPANKQRGFAQYVSDRGYNNPEMRKGEEIIVPANQLSLPPSQS